ncbi:MAG: PilT/PilU family type 4a pilus ATPase [Mariprofundus sp.]|nr:PilT/PilU family type 4a pilus ATPase [Mariprofundus sp.]
MLHLKERPASIKKLLTEMEERGASDLYITTGMAPTFRINNNMLAQQTQALSATECINFAELIMSEAQKATFSLEHEMNLALSFDDIGRFRVNIFYQRGNIGMVIRKIKTDVPSLDGLGLPPIFKDIVMAPRGLVLMVGATGCGKSTSLAAMIDWRNSEKAGHIISIEDPIEFIHQHKRCMITQREVGSDTLDYHTALKNTLRQAPDVILIGEIRDRQTMEHALEFAETGHLCMATLHANSANQALERIINFFPIELHAQVKLNLALNMHAILSQRLVKTHIGKRTPAIETLINTPRIADLIGKWDIEAIKEAMAAGQNYGMQTFDQALLQLWLNETISEQEALRHADSVNNMQLQIKMIKLKGNNAMNSASTQSTSELDSSTLSI